MLMVTDGQDQIIRLVDCTVPENLCTTISSVIEQVAKFNREVVKIVVQTNRLGEQLFQKELTVANMCGKIAHVNLKHIHVPQIKPYIVTETNNFGKTDSVYTKVCNFHTGINNTSTLLRAGIDSKEISRAIAHVFVIDNIFETRIHNIVYSARVGRPISKENKVIGRVLQAACGCNILEYLLLEDSMFVHSFFVRMSLASAVTDKEFLDITDMNIRINLCRTGVVNFFVGVPGGLPLDWNPEIKILRLCAPLLEAIVNAT